MIRKCALAAGLLLLGAEAAAAERVDQAQTSLDAARGFLGIGGESEQKLAQTFTAGLTGDLVALRLPIIGCARGDLVIEIRIAGPGGTPDGPLLGVTRIDPALAPVSGAALHDFRLAAPVRIRASAQYAFVLRMEPEPAAFCSYAHSPVGPDLYARGALFHDTRPNPPGWIPSASTGGESDLAFETVVETGSPAVAGGGRNCLIPGAPAGAPPIPEHLPICRCLRDESLREFRCSFLHPDFFAIRRTPWPIELGRPYTESWEVLPLTKLPAPIIVRLEGAGVAQPVDLGFKGASRKSLQARTVTLKAPEKPGLKATATLFYGENQWAIDRSFPAEAFQPPAPLAQAPNAPK